MIDDRRDPRTFETAAFQHRPGTASPHVQTMLGRALRPRSAVPWLRRRFELEDGDFVDLDHLASSGAMQGKPRRPIVLLLHGLEGSSASGYMGTTALNLVERGMDVVALNFRSCSGEPNRLPRSYHSGETGDLRAVIARIAKTAPGAPLGLIGFSLGGNVLLKYLGEAPTEVHPAVRAAAAVSVPFDLAAGALSLETGISRVYGWRFLRSLKARARSKAALFPGVIDLEAAEAARSIRTFDDRITAPVHGFEGADEYYRTCSSARFVEAIRTPTLILHAVDDPFLPKRAIPFSAIERNGYLAGVFTKTGGHLGFVEAGGRARRGLWPERESARYMAETLNRTMET